MFCRRNHVLALDAFNVRNGNARCEEWILSIALEIPSPLRYAVNVDTRTENDIAMLRLCFAGECPTVSAGERCIPCGGKHDGRGKRRRCSPANADRSIRHFELGN